MKNRLNNVRFKKDLRFKEDFRIKEDFRCLGAFKYYVIKEVGRWGQNVAIFDDFQYCKSSKRWVGLKRWKTWRRNTWMVPYLKCQKNNLPKLSAQAQKFRILMKKRLHWASIVRVAAQCTCIQKCGDIWKISPLLPKRHNLPPYHFFSENRIFIVKEKERILNSGREDFKIRVSFCFLS